MEGSQNQSVEAVLWGVGFNDPSVLEIALKFQGGWKKSWSYRIKRGHSVQSLEQRAKFQALAYAGDRVLLAVLDLKLAEEYWQVLKPPETLGHNTLLSNRNLALVFDRLGIIRHVNINRNAGVKTKASTYEALVGAIYIDQGFEAARRFVVRTLLPEAS